MANLFNTMFGDSTQVPYPTASSGVGVPACGGAVAPLQKDNLFNRIFQAEQLPYPAAACAPSRTPASTSETPKIPIVASSSTGVSLPLTRTMRGYVISPEFTSSYAEAHETLVASQVGEVLTPRARSVDGHVLSLLVPEGCDSLELSFGAVETNPGIGFADDVEELVTVGAPRTSKVIERGLVPGEQISVVVPWRAASWVDMPAGRLRAKVIATFSTSQS